MPGWAFPPIRLDAGFALTGGLRGIYRLPGILGMQVEQYLFARKST